MAKVHGKVKEFACQMCPKKFVYNYQLKTHILTHAQLKNKDKQSSKMEAAGVTDVLTKSLGSNNPVNLVRATVEGLVALRHPSEVVEARRALTGAN